LKDTFLQLSDSDKGKKKEVRLKAYCVCKEKLEGTQYKLTTEIAQKSRDSMLLNWRQSAGLLSMHNLFFISRLDDLGRARSACIPLSHTKLSMGRKK
jgi:hypothetical protein